MRHRPLKACTERLNIRLGLLFGGQYGRPGEEVDLQTSQRTNDGQRSSRSLPAQFAVDKPRKARTKRTSKPHRGIEYRVRLCERDSGVDDIWVVTGKHSDFAVYIRRERCEDKGKPNA